MSANPLNLPLPVVVDNLLPLLSNRDLAALRSVSKQAKILVEDQILWKRKVLADFTFPPHATARMGGWFELYRGLSNPQVYVWGQVSNGRLGLDPKNIHKACGADVVRTHGGMPYPVKLETINRSSSHGITLQTSPKEESTGAVVEMIAGGWSFHARTSLGKVWYWGTLDGSTFVGDLCPLRDPRKPIASPTLLHGIPDVESLSGGRLHAVALTKDHSLLEWRAWGSIWKLEGFPSSIIDPPSSSSKLEYYRHQDQDASTPMKSNIKQLEAGWTFSAILTHTGEIWIWYSEWCADAFERSYYSGYPREAMMYANPPGYGDQIVFPLTVTPVKLPPVYSGEQQEHADRVVQIAAGEDFIITLTQAGKMHKMDLHLPPPNQDDNRELYRARETMTDADDQDVEALFHRIRINLFVQNRARWESLCAFEQPQYGASFDRSWLESKAQGEIGSVGKISHISAHFRQFVAFLSITPPDTQHEDGREEQGEGGEDGGGGGEFGQTLVLLGSPTSNEPKLIPELQARGVIKVTMGDYHFGALTESGEILTWGSFSKGALGNWTPPWKNQLSSPSLLPQEQGQDDRGTMRGWSNLIPLAQILRPAFSSIGARQPRIGFAGRGGRVETWNHHRNDNVDGGGQEEERVQSQQDVQTPTMIKIQPLPEPEVGRDEGGEGQLPVFAFDIAFAGWHSSALVMQPPSTSPTPSVLTALTTTSASQLGT